MPDAYEQENSQQREKWRREARRRGRIKSFAAYQRNVRHNWVCLGDIVEWCASTAPVQTVNAQEEARAFTSLRLLESVKSGEFDRGGRSQVLCLVPDVYVDRGPEGALHVSFPRLRLTRKGAERAAAAAAQFDTHFGLSPSPLPLLLSCWVPCDLARQWLTARGHPWPADFQSVNAAATRAAPLPSQSGGGTPDHPRPPEPKPPKQVLTHEAADRENASATPARPKPPIPRGAYFGALEEHIARLKSEVFADMSDNAVARRFVDYCETLIDAGKSAPPLPRDRRNISGQVGKIRERLATTRSKSAAPDTT
jgi:hypothetical protein